jgi:hypothetical protein
VQYSKISSRDGGHVTVDGLTRRSLFRRFAGHDIARFDCLHWWIRSVHLTREQSIQCSSLEARIDEITHTNRAVEHMDIHHKYNYIQQEEKGLALYEMNSQVMGILLKLAQVDTELCYRPTSSDPSSSNAIGLKSRSNSPLQPAHLSATVTTTLDPEAKS